MNMLIGKERALDLRDFAGMDPLGQLLGQILRQAVGRTNVTAPS